MLCVLIFQNNITEEIENDNKSKRTFRNGISSLRHSSRCLGDGSYQSELHPRHWRDNIIGRSYSLKYLSRNSVFCNVQFRDFLLFGMKVHEDIFLTYSPLPLFP